MRRLDPVNNVEMLRAIEEINGLVRVLAQKLDPLSMDPELDTSVQEEAAMALGEAAMALGEVPSEEGESRRLLESLQRRVVQELLNALQHAKRSRQVRVAAAVALGQIGDARIIAALFALRQDTDPVVCTEVERLLQDLQGAPLDRYIQDFVDRGRLGKVEVEVLLQALADPSTKSMMKVQTAIILGKIGGTDTIPALLPLLQDSDEEVRVAGSMALQMLQGPLPHEK